MAMQEDEDEMFDVESISWLPNCVITDDDVFTADEFICVAHGQESFTQFNNAMTYLESGLVANAIIGNLVDGLLCDDH